MMADTKNFKIIFNFNLSCKANQITRNSVNSNNSKKIGKNSQITIYTQKFQPIKKKNLLSKLNLCLLMSERSVNRPFYIVNCGKHQ